MYVPGRLVNFSTLLVAITFVFRKNGRSDLWQRSYLASLNSYADLLTVAMEDVDTKFARSLKRFDSGFTSAVDYFEDGRIVSPLGTYKRKISILVLILCYCVQCKLCYPPFCYVASLARNAFLYVSIKVGYRIITKSCHAQSVEVVIITESTTIITRDIRTFSPLDIHRCIP